MRNDLRVACVHCARRLPARFKVCPRCRCATRPPAEALAEIARDRGLSARVGRPVRDAFLFFPAIVGMVFCLSAAVGLCVAGSMAFSDSTAGGVGRMVGPVMGGFIGLFAGLGGAVAAAALIWVAWACAVMLVSWLAGGEPDRRLHPAPLPSQVAATPAPEPWAPRVAAWAKRKKRTAALLLVALFALELGAWLLSSAPQGRDLASIIGNLALAGGVQLLVLALSAVPVLLGLEASLWILDRARLTKYLLQARVAERAQAAGARRLGVLRIGRERVAGTAASESGALLVAPLSGERCLGFRLVGRVGTALLDDADTAPLAIDADGERVAVRAGALLLDLPPSTTAVPVLDRAARQRLTAFLEARRLPALALRLPGTAGEPAEGIELGETLLREGDAITAHGAITLEPAVAAGYRNTREARVLGDGDEQPVLVSAG